jgi:phosphoglycolate phosphatase
LIDGWAAIAAALNAVFRRHGMPEWTADQAQANVRGSLRDTFPDMFGAGWEQDANLFYTTLQVEHLAHLRAMAGAAELLEACAIAPCGVVSNKTGAFLRREVTHLGWDRYFGAVVGAGDAAADKPDAAPLRLALQRLGVGCDRRVWYVGDTALDMRSARAAGCFGVLLGEAAHDGGWVIAEPDARFGDAFELARQIAALAS